MAKRKTPNEVYQQTYAADFYQMELEKAEAGLKTGRDKIDHASYNEFVEFLFEGEEAYPGPYHRPLSFRDPMSYAQYCKILKDFSKEDMKEQVLQMQNYDDKAFWAKRVSFYLTMLDWLKRKASKNKYQYNNQPEKPTFASKPRTVSN